MAYVPKLDSGYSGGYRENVSSSTPKQQTTFSQSQQQTQNYFQPYSITPSVPKIPDIGTDDWINRMKKDLNKPTTTPKLPAPVNLDKYKTNPIGINELARKYGFDYSRKYAEKQANVKAQAQKDALASQRERLEYETESAKEDLTHGYFKKYLEQRQELSDRGMNAGIAAESNLKLEMSKQHDLADILANAQLRNQELDRNEAQIERERLAYIEQLYNDRLQQGFKNAMDYNRFIQSENQWMGSMAMQQRRQAVEEAWREHRWNNMSYSEKQQLLVDIEKYGMDMAWERHKFEAGMQFEAGLAGGIAGNASFAKYPVTSGYGGRKDPFTGKQSNHKGIDFGTPMNTPIQANVSGTVIHSGYTNGGFGTYVAIKDANGLVHIYGHLNAANVKKGQKVSAGTLIGKSGNSGRSSGPHLHYEVRRGSIGGSSIDPTPFI